MSPTARAAAADIEGGNAPWWRRAVALIVDNLLLSIPLVFVIVLFAGDPDAASEEGSALETALVLLWFALPFLYFAYFHGGESRQTLGKRMMGIAVRPARDHGRLGYGKAFLRYLAVLMLGFFVLPLIFDYLWPLFDSKNRALHDKMISTVVVRV